jgi:hypothetical protein
VTANTPQSRKAKGRNAQKQVVDEILLRYSDSLTANDVKSTPMGVNESDVWLSEKALTILPFEIEVKAQEKLNIWDALKQCETRATKNGRTPVVFFKKNRTEMYCVLSMKKFFDIVQFTGESHGTTV